VQESSLEVSPQYHFGLCDAWNLTFGTGNRVVLVSFARTGPCRAGWKLELLKKSRISGLVQAIGLPTSGPI